MEKIPYSGKLTDENVWLLKPNGEVFETGFYKSCEDCENVIKNYCIGPDYYELLWAVGCEPIAKNYIEKKELFETTILDPLMGSQLSEKDKEKLKKYLAAYKNKELVIPYYELYNIFVICYLGWTRFSPIYGAIDTAVENPEDRFSGFVSEEWEIFKFPPIAEDANGKLYFDTKDVELRKIYEMYPHNVGDSEPYFVKKEETAKRTL